MSGNEALERTEGEKISPRRFSLLSKIGMAVFFCCVTGIVAIAWRQSGPAAIFKGIEARGGLVVREPTAAMKLIGDLIPGMRSRRDGKSGIVNSLTVLDATEEEIRLLGSVSSITNLRMFRGRVTESLLETLRGLPNLTSLTLYDFNLTDEELKQVIDSLPHPEKLIYIGLRNTNLTDAGLASLGKCTSLTRLYIDGSKIDGSGFSKLAGPSLFFLNLTNSEVTDKNLNGIVKSVGGKLSTLQLDGSRITDEGLIVLRGVPNLGGLGVGGTEVTPHGLSELMKRRPLLTLSLRELPWTMNDLTSLPLGAKFGYLDLSDWKITDESLKSIPDLPNLSGIDLSGCGISDAGLTELARFPRLTYVRLDQTKVTLSGVLQLTKQTKLHGVSVGQSGVDYAALLAAPSLGTLQGGNLDGMNLTNEQLRELSRKHPTCTFRADDRIFIP